MKSNQKLNLIILCTCFLLLFNACQEKKIRNLNEVIVHELSDPDKLNPITSTSANSSNIENQIFMYLIDVNKATSKMNPSLAVDHPTITKIEDGEYAGGLSIEYEIRPEAVWDNGDPVTAYDVDFTYKAVRNPKVDAEQYRPYLDFIKEIVIDEENPKKFTFYTDQQYFGAEFSSGGQVHIAPEYIYDPNRVMRKFTLKEMGDEAMSEVIRSDPDLNAYANELNSEKYQREKGFVVGCGPYNFESWATSQRIILTKKENWWGDKLIGQAANFEAYPDKIVYEIINDWTTAITALKDGSIDIVRNMRPRDYKDLSENSSYKDKINLFNPMQYSYYYIGLNMKDPRLSDVRVRRAIAHTVDRQRMIDVLVYGYAEPTNGPFHPTKEYYNKDIKAKELDHEKAKSLLDEAGWKDTDNDGIRDKVIDGKKIALKLEFKYNTGNDTREQIGLLLKNSASKVGIGIEIVGREWTVFIDETKKHDFEMYVGGWVQDPIMDDPKQLWFTESYNGGSNYVGFGDEASDALIESIRSEMNSERRTELYKQFQARIDDETPYIFLFSRQNLMAISNRFSNPKSYVARPGYSERELKVKVLAEDIASKE